MAEELPERRTLVTIPSVYGLTRSQALGALSRAGFEPVASPRRFRAEDDSAVDRTLPPEGALALPGSRVDLLPPRAAADEPRTEEPSPQEVLITQGIMPDFTGWLPEEAVPLLERFGFRAWPRTRASDSEPDFIFASDPRPNTPLNVLLVTLWVAEAPPPEEFRKVDPFPERIIKEPLKPKNPVLIDEEEDEDR